MKVSVKEKGVFQSLLSRDIRAYLEAQGWKPTDRIGNKAIVLSKDEIPYELLLPLRKELGDYALRVAELISTIAQIEDRSEISIVEDIGKSGAIMKGKPYGYHPWNVYNKSCERLITEFLNKYYPLVSIYSDSVNFVGSETGNYTNVFEVGDRFYSVEFCAECLLYDATFDDIESYKNYGLECSFHEREVGISFENWVKYPKKRKPFKEQPFTAEGQLKMLLVKCIPALEGITHYEDLLKEIEEKFLPPF